MAARPPARNAELEVITVATASAVPTTSVRLGGRAYRECLEQTLLSLAKRMLIEAMLPSPTRRGRAQYRRVDHGTARSQP